MRWTVDKENLIRGIIKWCEENGRSFDYVYGYEAATRYHMKKTEDLIREIKMIRSSLLDNPEHSTAWVRVQLQRALLDFQGDEAHKAGE